jgi:hypothetical protein
MYNLDSDFEVQGFIKPGAGLRAITNTVKEEVKFLTKNDVVIVWGGTRGIGRNEYRILVGKPEGKRSLGRPRRMGVDNIKMDLTEIGWDGMDWIDLAEDRDQ